MTLIDIRNMFFAPPQLADFDVYPLEYAPELHDAVINIARDCTGTVEGVGYPYTDGIERYYVVATDLSWADWLTLSEIF